MSELREVSAKDGLEPYSREAARQADKEKKPFLIVRVLREIVNGIHRVTIPKETDMATTKQGRKEIEDDPNPEMWRWAAGGTLVILHCKDRSVAVVLQRDHQAPRYGGAWTMGSGLSSPDDDLSNPTGVAVREGFEEVRIAVKPKPGRAGVPKDREAGIVQPVFGDPELDMTAARASSGSEMDMTHPDVPDVFNTRMHFKREEKVRVDATFYRAPGEETLEVVHEDGSAPTTRQSGTIAIDPKTRGVDFLKVVEVDLTDYYFDEVTLFDGEVGQGGAPLNRTVGCLDVRRERNEDGSTKSLTLTPQFVGAQKGGKDVDHSGLVLDQMTPTLAKMFESVNGESLDPEKLRTFLGGLVNTESTRGNQPTFSSLMRTIATSGADLTKK